ncbi:anti-sigma factor [Actinoallomurus bryophytorum]|uniref:Regulator of SigK n=1 Tax=Actinoallomurus bryophytorum TaxID=1490222 RepID=A0A543CHS2_9ACTN|nr:anti-sigma factor [Actinoallomurus bryophytorum]TQL96638.1 anti-sigma-K factor RskA [Actinoallomurus bryophytorum]
MTDDELHTLTGAYALNALDEREAEEFARHLVDCEACIREVRELQAIAALLARAVAETPPPELRQRVMAAIGEVRQLPPQIPPQATVVSLRRWRSRGLPYLAAAACLVLAVVAGGFAVQARHQADQQRSAAAQAQQQAARLTTLMSASDATLRGGAVHGGGSATLVASRQLNQAALVYQGLPALAGGKVYELWYSVSGSMVPAGLLASGRPDGTTLFKGGPQGAAAVGVTIEPAGGSPKPTTDPILLLPVST